MKLIMLLFVLFLFSGVNSVFQNIDLNWKFNITTQSQPRLADCSVSECMATFDDSKWSSVNVPHDFVVHGVFSQSADMSHGYLPYAKGWYRKLVDVPESGSGKVFLHFDGTQRDVVVFFNQKYLGNHLSGYTPHEYDVTAYVKPTGNLIAVYVDATAPDGWWYDGGGIYRHVYFRVTSSLVYLDPLSIYVPTKLTSEPKLTGREGSGIANAQVTASISVINDGTSAFSGSVSFSVTGFSSATQTASVAARSNGSVKSNLQLTGVNLWGLDNPALQTLTVDLKDSTGKSIDQLVQIFGVRETKWDPNSGFSLNSQPVKIKGLANHQDFAGVGVAVPDSLQAFRVAKLKEMGGNAWRTAHNPPNPALLDECDKQGFLVWDENHRNIADGGQWVADLRALILRDRNHPSIILWSICNEVLCMNWNATSARILKGIIKELDPDGNRPVTAAMNNGWGNDFSGVLDVEGFNYSPGQYSGYHKAHPQQPLIGSETASALSDRGIYTTSTTAKTVSSYDVNSPSWGNTAEAAMQAIYENDYMSGDFVWTGFDYKGEPTPYNWPNINSHFGIIDIAGFPKDSFYYYQTVWGSSPTLHVFPHWNWNTGSSVNVWVYANAASVTLYLNGNSLGSKTVTSNTSGMGRVWYSHVEWNVPFAAGNLTAIGFDKSGKQISSDTRITAGEPAGVKLSVEWPKNGQLKADGVDVALVTCEIVDSKGVVVPTATNEVQISLSGSGIILGTGNGYPNSHEPDYPVTPQSASRSAFAGQLRVVVQSSTTAGTITVTAKSGNLSTNQISIKVN